MVRLAPAVLVDVALARRTCAASDCLCVLAAAPHMDDLTCIRDERLREKSQNHMRSSFASGVASQAIDAIPTAKAAA